MATIGINDSGDRDIKFILINNLLMSVGQILALNFASFLHAQRAGEGGGAEKLSETKCVWAHYKECTD